MSKKNKKNDDKKNDDKKSNENFLEKYSPKTMKDLIVPQYVVDNLTTWLDTYNINAEKNRHAKKRPKTQTKIFSVNEEENDNNENNDNNDNNENNDEMTDEVIGIANKKKQTSHDKSCAIVTGAHGTGKTTFVKTVLKAKKYDTYVVDFEKINNMENMVEFVPKLLQNRTVLDVMNKKAKTKRAIIVDNVEIVSSPNEKTFITNLIMQNEQSWSCPIIFICNNKHNKVINSAKKMSYEIKINIPSKENLKHVMFRIMDKENMIFESEKICDKLIEHSNNDLRLMISNLQTIKNLYNGDFGEDELSDFVTYYKMKDQDLDIYVATKRLMYGYDNINDVIKIFETEKIIMPLMMQQHHVNFLGNQNFDTVKKIANSLSKGDVIENYIYDHNIYDIRDTQAYYQCVYPSYKMTKCLNPQKKIDVDNLKIMTPFPNDLNKTSIKHINYTKNIVPSNTYFKNMKLDDYMYLDKVMRDLIDSDAYNEINNVIDKYNIDTKGIESALKINKLNDEKFSISTKMKKIMIKSCSNLIDKE